MCRWAAYSGDPVYLEDLILSPAHSLIEQSHHARQAKTAINGDGFGVAWYGDRDEPGLYRDILPAWADRNLAEPRPPDPLGAVPGPCPRLDHRRDQARQLPSLRLGQLVLHAQRPDR